MPGKIRVLHFIWSANFGGIEKLAIDLTTAQNQTDKVYAEILVGCNKGSFKETLNNPNTPHRFAGLKNGFDFNFSIFNKIVKLMKTFDIIHFHTFNIVIALAAIFSRKKIVYTIHGNFNFGRKITISDKITNLLRKYFLNNSVDFVSFNSEFTKNYSLKKYHLRSRKNKVIYNGIAAVDKNSVTVIENQSHRSFLKDKFIVGTTSRFNQFKRIDRLIESFAEFSKNKTDVVLLLVGDGVVKNKLSKLVDQKEITEKTLFTGYQSNVLSYQKAITVGVFPSENEPFGLVAVETLSLGKPTIVFQDAGGMLEIVQKEFPEDVVVNISALTERLNYYYLNQSIENSQLISRRIKHASGFNIESMEHSFYEEYVSILK